MNAENSCRNGTTSSPGPRQCRRAGTLCIWLTEGELEMRVIEKADIGTIEPLLCSVQAATAIIGRSERFIIDAIARGYIDAVKSDRRTLVIVQSLKDYVAALPPARGTINH